MALTIETGAIVADADSFISIEDADALLASLGTPEDSWVFLLEDEKEAALRVAYRYIADRWDDAFVGMRLRPAADGADPAQTGAWPRRGAYYPEGITIGDDVIPAEVVQAQALYALAAQAQALDLYPSQAVDPSGRPLVELEVEVGPVRERKRFVDGMALGLATRRYPQADRRLSRLLIGGGRSRAIRA